MSVTDAAAGWRFIFSFSGRLTFAVLWKIYDVWNIVVFLCGVRPPDAKIIFELTVFVSEPTRSMRFSRRSAMLVVVFTMTINNARNRHKCGCDASCTFFSFYTGNYEILIKIIKKVHFDGYDSRPLVRI